jgi:hypothetical protein
MSSGVTWSDRRTNVLSLLLAAAGYFIVPVLKRKGLLTWLPDMPTFGHLADTFTILAVMLGLLAPRLGRLLRYTLRRLRPQPGATALADAVRRDLKQAFEVDRRTFGITMVPSHPETAAAAKSSRKIDFGDAALVLTRPEQQILRTFVAAGPAKRSGRHGQRGKSDRNVLLVTGEPGAGKSVLLQELYATLSLGVEEGHHSFVPFLFLARDLTLDVLHSVNEAEAPMQALLSHYYKRRSKDDTEKLLPLYDLVAARWQTIDALVIIDGLDEIAQRSAYEDIQRLLSAIILKDIKSSGSRVHRFVLSCRIDEDLELFPDAQSIVLRGLSDERREAFCRHLVARGGLDRAARGALEEVLRTQRATPSHVFRRNPYFLSLLVRHLRDDEQRVRNETLDFELLMRSYLAREAERPYTTTAAARSVTVEERRALFSELEKVSRLGLQYLAYSTASTSKIGALYDEVALAPALLQGFASAVASAPRMPSASTAWTGIDAVVRALVDGARTKPLSNSEMHRFAVDSGLHENDLRTLETLAGQLRNGNASGAELVSAAIGTIPYKGFIESPAWYEQFAEVCAVAASISRTATANALTSLLFIRSIAAAHALRIVSCEFDDSRITVRFRHRRLAEFYAAGYIRDYWRGPDASLRFSPWLAPVLNLTCALEGSECRTLAWLVDRLGDVPSEPRYEWRHAVESAVEAAYFAHPGPEYSRAVERLVGKIVRILANAAIVGARGPTHGRRSALASHASQASQAKVVPVDAVTQMVLLRSLESLGHLRNVAGPLQLPPATRSEFTDYAERAPVEWMAATLPARSAIEQLSRTRYSLRNTASMIWRLVADPSAILFSGTGRWPGKWQFFLPVLVLTVVGEAVLLAASTAVFAGLLTFAANRSTRNPGDVEGIAATGAIIALTSIAIVRLLAWLREHTKAAQLSVSPWTIPPRIPGAIMRELDDFIDFLRTILDLNWQSLREAFDELSKRLRALAVAIGLRRGLLFSTGFVIMIASGLAVAAVVWPPDKPASRPKDLTPCPKIAAEFGRIGRKYLRVQGWNEVYAKELRTDLDSLARLNKDDCGMDDTIDGGWTVSQHRLADFLVESDPRTVPAPIGEPLVNITSSLTTESIQAPPAQQKVDAKGFLGYLSTVHRRWILVGQIDRVQAFRTAVRDARRRGHGLDGPLAQQVLAPKGADAKQVARGTKVSILASNRAIELSSNRLKSLRASLDTLDNHVGWIRVQGLLLLFVCGMTLVIAFPLVTRWRDRRWLKRIAGERKVQMLCRLLRDQRLSERVRLQIIQRIDEVGIDDHRELSYLERSVGKLLSRASPIEGTIAVKAARLARTLGNRLQHRTTTDVALTKTPPPPPSLAAVGGASRG